MKERFGLWALVIFIFVTPLLVEILKAVLPKAVKGVEKWLALVLPLVASLVMKLAGLFQTTPLEDAVIQAVLAGYFGQTVHDKTPKPAFLTGLLGRLLGRDGKTGGTP